MSHEAWSPSTRTAMPKQAEREPKASRSKKRKIFRGGHDEEGNQCREEGTNGLEAEDRHLVEVEVGATGQATDDLEQEVGERGDDAGERGRDDQTGRDLDQVSLEQELLEALHGTPSTLLTGGQRTPHGIVSAQECDSS